jgi:hypothetical protein
LVQHTSAQAVNLGTVANAGRVECCTAVSAESLRSQAATLGSFDVDLWLPLMQFESIFQAEYDESKCRPREHLAISAVTNGNVFRVDLRSKFYRATMALTVYFHVAPSIVDARPDNDPGAQFTLLNVVLASLEQARRTHALANAH